MKTIFTISVLLFVTTVTSATSFGISVPLDVTFSAYLGQPSSGEPLDDFAKSTIKARGGAYFTFDLFCEKSLVHCSLWVYSISDEYCNDNGSPPNQRLTGFNYDYYPDISVRNAGRNLSFDFESAMLFGKTHNEIRIVLAAKPNTQLGEAIVTDVSGTASSLYTTLDVPLQSFYRKLDTRVLCKLGFFPVGQRR